MYMPNRGELALIPGVQELAHTIPGLESIGDIYYLEQSFGDQGWLMFYDWDSSLAVAPTVSSFSIAAPTGAPSGTRDLVIQYVFPGGTTKNSVKASCSYGTNSGETYMDVTIPTSIPSSVYCVNFAIYANSGSHAAWAGSIMRKNGVFPTGAEATLRIPVTASTVTGNNKAIGAIQPSSFSYNPTTSVGGELEGGRLYYFGICPWLQQNQISLRYNRVALTDASNNVFAAYLPEGYNTLEVQFISPPTSTGDDLTTTVSKYIVFAGATPEDMAPVGTALVHGATPISIVGGAVSCTVKSLPYNTNMAMSMGAYEIGGSFALPEAEAIDNRYFGSFDYQSSVLGAGGFWETDNVGDYALAYIQLPYSSTTHREMLPGNQYALNKLVSFEDVLDPIKMALATGANQIFTIKEKSVGGAVYQNRLWFTDRYRSPHVCNGYVVTPAIVDATRRVFPITDFISSFNDRLIFAGGPTNTTYDDGNVNYTDVANPNYVIGSLNSNVGDASDIVGVGVFSRDLADNGPTAFLALGKKNSTYTWSGVTSDGLVQIGKAAGWMSAKGYALTKYGAVVATNNGLYAVSGSDMKPLSPDTEKIFQEISVANRELVQLVNAGDRLICSYRDTANLDRELWIDFREDPEGLIISATGPHVMKAYDSQAVALSYGTVANYRVSALGTKLYRRDVPSVFTNDTADIAVVLRFNDTGLGNDEFLKILTRLYLRAKINKQETVTISVPSRDAASDGDGLDYSGTGLQTVSESMILPYSGGAEIYRMFQKVFASRYRGSIFTPQLSLSTNVDFRIVSISFLYNLVRRRLL